MSFDSVIATLNKTLAADRRIDLAISAAINWRGAFAPIADWRWSVMADELEGYQDGKRRAILDPAQFAPRWTALLDQAVKLVPEDWFWQVGHTSAFRAWAKVYATHPDHGEEGRNEFIWRQEYWQAPATSPVIALCIVALEARRVLAKKPASAG